MREPGFQHVVDVLERMGTLLARQPHEGVSQTLSRLAEHPRAIGDFRPPAPQDQAVTRYLDDCLQSAAHFDAELAQAITRVAPQLRWQQSDSYTDDVLGTGFSQNYAWAELIGAQGFFRGIDFKLGLLLLGPYRHYLEHYHPAPELYWPLTPASEWKKGAGPFVARRPGEIIWHPSMVVHATITHEQPLLAVYAWTRDVAVGARLCADDRLSTMPS